MCRPGLALTLLLAVLLPIAACDSEGEDVITAEVTVMSYNLYLGADIFDLVGIPNEEVPVVAAQLFGAVQATDFPARAEAIADLIEDADPDLIGLQEVSLYRTQTPADNLPGGAATPASDVAFDFLEILLDALEARGLVYVVAAETENADVEVPSTTDGMNFTDIRLTDRDVILARQGVPTSNAVEANFNVFAPIPVGDSSIDFLRGYNSVEAEIDGVTFTFANSHLEVQIPNAPAQPQEGQALELLTALDNAERPVVLVGDFNSPADGSGTNSYNLLTDRYDDAFDGIGGATCCQAADLLNDDSELETRIDLILTRGEADVLSAEVIGEEEADKTDSGLWPSDHAGVVATLELMD
ncbi:MAG: endonuclease/exonuclease/phosphatase family protein [Rhodothermales bacterium]|nr:endonuclease/exonuclease/phosphatase family protein [Rhodothermales bacterium]